MGKFVPWGRLSLWMKLVYILIGTLIITLLNVRT